MSESPPIADASPASPPSLSSWRILTVWFLLGLQSFGGGGATLTLIRRAVVEEHGWMSEAEFSRDWTLCQIAPGINLIAMCILVGRKIAGARGSVLCLFGLLLPSVSITVLLTALYAPVRDSEIVKAALRGVIPASVGLGLLTAYNVATPPLKDSAKEGKLSGGFGVTLIGLSAAAMVYGKLPVVSILAGLGGISALFQVWRQRQASPKTTETP